jgi:hypothetical protein
MAKLKVNSVKNWLTGNECDSETKYNKNVYLWYVNLWYLNQE